LQKKASHISQIRESGNGDISLTVAIYARGFQAQVFFPQAPQLILLLCFMFSLQIGPQSTVNNFDQMEKQRVYQY